LLWPPFYIASYQSTIFSTPDVSTKSLKRKVAMRLKKLIYTDINESNRQVWLKSALSSIPAGWRMLDAGAGELKK
jgi:hypothetical protein